MPEMASQIPWPAEYAPGDWTVLAGENTWALVDLGADTVLRTKLWACVTRGAPLDELLSELTRLGVRTAPAFAVLQRSGDTATAIVRGAARVIVDRSSDHAYDIRGTAVTTWIENNVVNANEIELVGTGEADPTRPSLPLGVGVALARVVRLVCRDVLGLDAGDGVGEGIDVSPSVAELPQPEIGLDRTPAAESPPSGSRTLQHDDVVAFRNDTLPSYAPTSIPLTESTDAADQGEPVLHDSKSPGPQGAYDHLFEATQRRTVEGAAVRPDDEQALPTLAAAKQVAEPSPGDITDPAVPPTPSIPGWSAVAVAPLGAGAPGMGAAAPGMRSGPAVHHVGAPRPSEPAAAATENAAGTPSVPPMLPMAATPGAAGIIESTPWASSDRSLTYEQPQANAAVSVGDQSIEANEKTVQRSAVARVIAQATVAASHVGPTVQAVQCPRGHFNPAHAAICRVCAQALTLQDPVTIPRPVLGVLRLSTGDVVTLDRGVVLGRSPRADFGGKAERPHVVRLPSPGQDISRTHVEVRIEGWHVLVTDLDSTNGTMIAVPGEEPRRLRPNDPTMIPPGTLVSLADEVSFHYGVTE